MIGEAAKGAGAGLAVVAVLAVVVYLVGRRQDRRA